MSGSEILDGLKSLPIAERLSIVETVVHQLREEIAACPTNPAEISSDLARAAEALRESYTNDEELTAFTALDADPVHA
jgi:hypothetical protein